MLDSLEPLTSYQFELRVCTVSLKHNCSLWSQLVNQKSLGQGKSSTVTEAIHCFNNTLHYFNVLDSIYYIYHE